MATSDGSITFKTDLDNSDLEKQLKDTEKKIESLKKSIEKDSSTKTFLEGRMDDAKKATEEARQAVERLREELGVSDEGRLTASLKEANREVASLEAKITKTDAAKTAIEEQMDRGEAAIGRTEQKLRNLQSLLAELNAVDPNDADEWFGAQREIGGVNEAITEQNALLERQIAEQDSLNDRWQDLDTKSREYATSLQDASARQEELSSKSTRLSEANALLKEQAAEQGRLTSKWKATNEQIERNTEYLTQLQGRQKTLATEYAASFSQIGNSVTSAMSKAKAAMTGFAQRLGTMLKQALVFSVIYRGLRAIKSGIADALKQNVRFSASWEALKATVNGFAIGVANVVAPVISSVVNFATKMIMNLAQLVDMVFGTRIAQAIASAQQSAEQAWRQTPESEQAAKDEEDRLANLEKAEQAAEDAANAEDDQAKAAKKLAKAQKKANEQVMAFDELNKLAEESSEDVEDAMDDYADDLGGTEIDPSLYDAIDPGEYLQPDWDALDVGKIEAKLAELMTIIGAALLAVGAILAFSGINIPLGLTLMVIGALMMYTAMQEMWDKLPQETQEAITNAITITAIVLIVLGAVLAFSGINIPLGIGMMAAGAILLYPMMAVNWEYMSTEMQEVITALMTILGVALLVIGAVLAFTGVNLPLGIGLMMVGAILLGSAVALNWEYFKENFEVILPAIEAVLGGSLLVIGAILAFSGANIPLGIGLMLVGAVSLGKAVTEDWEKVPDEVKSVLGMIELALGGAVLVVGAILAFSGINIPLGIALMAVGAVSLGHALTENWDYMPEQVRIVIAVIESIVAPALLALGAILVFTAVNLPLGIALIAAGALMLAHLATLNWDAMPEGIRNAVSTILGIVGGALIVVGIILCVTGVGIPLGIALIAAGAVSLIAAAAINWDFIVDKVREVWENVKSFWDSNIAHVFTWEFWEGVFRSIVNGLISCINSGLNAFGDFVNNISAGVSDLLNFFGVEGWSFSITMPQIPYLAQGAVIPPNREFMAVLGDQRSGNNIEAPESLMRQVVREEAGQLIAEAILALGSQGLGDTGGDVTLVLNVDGDELSRAVGRGDAARARRGELRPQIAFA